MTQDIVKKHISYGDRHALVVELGELLRQAARASIVHGAIYESGEHIEQDPVGAWQRVAARLLDVIANPVAGEDDD